MYDANREYLTNRILSASPMELIRMLYQGALDSVRRAVDHLHRGEIMERGRAISKACAIIDELQASLEPVPGEDYSNRLDRLYGYMRQQLVRAHVEKSEKLLLEVAGLLATLLEGWSGSMPAAEPVAANPAYFAAAPTMSEGPRSWSF